MSFKETLVGMIPSPLQPFWRRIERSPLGYRLLRGAFWSLMAAFIGQGLTMLANVVAARILGREEFGELNMVQSTVVMFGVFSGWALGLTATRYVADFKSNEKDRAGRIIALTSLIAWISSAIWTVLLFFLAEFIASDVINAPHLALHLKVGCLLLLFNAINGAQNGILAGFEAFKTLTWSNTARGIISFPAIVIGIYLAGIVGAVVGMIITAFLGLIINFVFIRVVAKRNDVKIRYDHLGVELPLIWRFSLPNAVSGALIAPSMWGAKAILANIEDGYIHIGIFTAAFQIKIILQFMNTRVGAVLVPMLSSEEGRKSDLFNRSNLLISWIFGVAVCLPIIAFPELMGLIFGDKFSDRESFLTLLIIMCYSTITFYNSGMVRILVAKSMMGWDLLSNIVWALVLLGSAVWLVRFGAPGLSFAFLLAYTAKTVSVLPLYLQKELIPRELLVSIEALLIWLPVVILAFMSYYHVFWGWRLIVVMVFIGIVGGAAYRLLFVYSRKNMTAQAALSMQTSTEQ